MHLPLNTSGESHVVLLCAGRLCPECGPSVWAAAHPLWQHAARHAARQHVLPAGSGSALCTSPQSAHAAPQRPTVRTCLLPRRCSLCPLPCDDRLITRHILAKEDVFVLSALP